MGGHTTDVRADGALWGRQAGASRFSFRPSPREGRARCRAGCAKPIEGNGTRHCSELTHTLDRRSRESRPRSAVRRARTGRMIAARSRGPGALHKVQHLGRVNSSAVRVYDAPRRADKKGATTMRSKVKECILLVSNRESRTWRDLAPTSDNRNGTKNAFYTAFAQMVRSLLDRNEHHTWAWT